MRRTNSRLAADNRTGRLRLRLTLRARRFMNAIIGCVAVRRCSRQSGCSIPTQLSRVTGAVMRRLGPWLPEHRHRPRQPQRRIPGKVAGRNRGHPARRVGQSRPRRRRVRPYRPALGLPSAGQAGAGRIMDSNESEANRAATARRRQASPDIFRASGQLGARGRRRRELRVRHHGALPASQTCPSSPTR